MLNILKILPITAVLSSLLPKVFHFEIWGFPCNIYLQQLYLHTLFTTVSLTGSGLTTLASDAEDQPRCSL